METYGPQTEAAQTLHQEKYRETNETFRECMQRVAHALSDDDDHYYALRDILLDMRFLFGGRIQAAVGSNKHITAFNCFVSGTIGDTLTNGSDSIMQRALEAAQTMRMGGGIGYDFSTLRPRGALIHSLMSYSSGPVSFMSIFDAICTCIASAGNRRGAQMGVLRVDHPDIEEFIHAKNNKYALTGFNTSIAITDDFMKALIVGNDFDLKFNREVYRTINPKILWEAIMRSTWDWGEPGVLFIDTINKTNPLNYCEYIAATNPCAEQPLPPFGACLLGSFNLVKYLHKGHSPHQQVYWLFDDAKLKRDIEHVVRAMDNVVDVALYPLPQQELEAKNKRRMGLGVTGLANTIEAMGFESASELFLKVQKSILRTVLVGTYKASNALAKEKGVFPLWDPEYYDIHPELPK